MKMTKKILLITVTAMLVFGLLSVSAAANHAHQFENGYCPECWAADPSYVHPCNNGHSMRNDGACYNCSYYNPDFVPGADNQPDTDADQDDDRHKNDNTNDGDVLITVMIVICVVLVAVLAVLVVLLLLKKKKQTQQ